MQVYRAAIYARFGLVGPRSVLAHCIHLEDDAFARMAAAGAAAAFCLTSQPVPRLGPVRPGGQGDDRVVERTYLAGICQHRRDR